MLSVYSTERSVFVIRSALEVCPVISWVLGVGCWVLGVGCWVLGVGCWVLGVVVVVWLLVVGCWLLVVGCWLLVVGCCSWMVEGVGCMKSHHLMPNNNDSVSGFGLSHVLPERLRFCL